MSSHCTISHRLHNALVNDLSKLPYKTLPMSTMYSPWTYQRSLWSGPASIISVLAMYRSYGFLFNRTGYMASYILPEEFEHNIKSSIETWFDYAFGDDLTIRLQVVWGSCIPLHRDKTRNASLIVPINHPQPSVTQFYISDYYDPETRTVYDPKFCELIDEVGIDSNPVLIDTTQIHGVNFLGTVPVVSKPRISIAAKWRKCLFNDLVQLICA